MVQSSSTNRGSADDASIAAAYASLREKCAGDEERIQRALLWLLENRRSPFSAGDLEKATTLTRLDPSRPRGRIPDGGWINAAPRRRSRKRSELPTPPTANFVRKVLDEIARHFPQLAPDAVAPKEVARYIAWWLASDFECWWCPISLKGNPPHAKAESTESRIEEALLSAIETHPGDMRDWPKPLPTMSARRRLAMSGLAPMDSWLRTTAMDIFESVGIVDSREQAHQLLAAIYVKESRADAAALERLAADVPLLEELGIARRRTRKRRPKADKPR